MQKTRTTEQLVEGLRQEVAASTFKLVAARVGISLPFLHDVVHGRRQVSEALGRKLGYRREMRWVAEANEQRD